MYGESLLDDEDYNEYSHINFITQPKEDHHHSSSSGVGSGHRLFFFAEAPRPPRKDFREEDISICCPIESSPGDIGTVNRHTLHFIFSCKLKDHIYFPV